MKKLNIGCGRDIKKDYINLDIIKLPWIDVVADIEKPLPFRDNLFDEIYAEDVLEHIINFNGLLSELHRISKSNGLIVIIVPHLSFFASYTDPTHKRFFGYHSFDYFTQDGDYNFYTTLRFEIIRRKIRFFWIKNKKRKIKSHFISWIINLWPTFYERFLCWILPSNDLYFELRPIK